MTTIDTRPDSADAALDDGGASGAAAWFVAAGAWITTADHKRIGRIYVGFGLLFLIAASAVGVLFGLERADDAGDLLDAGSIVQVVQAYRVGLVFGAVIPLTLGLAIAVAPLQLGARQIAFPRVALMGLYTWLGGFALNMAGLARNGGMGGGDAQAVELWVASLGLMIVGLVASAGSVATTVLTTRAPGMTMRRVPLFAWSALIGSLAMVIAMPIVLGIVIYLFLDHHYAQLNFGGSEGMVAWLGWSLSVPAVAVYALPAVGVAAELIPVTFRTRQPMRGVTFAGIALVGVTAFAATTQQFVHSVTVDAAGDQFVDDLIPFLLFAGLPVLGVVIVMALGALTAKNGIAAARPRVGAAFVFSFLGLGLIALGLIANAVMSITDLELLGTTFEEGATLLVVDGAALAVLGGLAFWSPKLWGRTLSDAKLAPLALLGAAGAALAAVPLCIAGLLDQPGGIPVNDEQVAAMLSLDGVTSGALWMILSLAGHAVIAVTVVAVCGLMFSTFTGSGDPAGDPVADNPAGGQTIEWTTSSPAPATNYAFVPTVASAEPALDAANEGNEP